MLHSKDLLWKGVLEWVCDDLLRFVFPNADEVFDLQRKFDFLDKELAELYPEPDRRIDVRFADKLVQVYRKDGGEEWVLIHIEVQDYTKPEDRLLFGARMFRYFYRCLDRCRRPVAAIAIFCGPDGKLLPGKYEYCFMNTRLHYEYTSLCILDYTDEELKESSNPFAWIMLAAKDALRNGKAIDAELLQGKLFIFRKLYKNGNLEKRKLQAILMFLKNYVRFAEPETYRIFNEQIDKITHKENTMDIFEVVEQMRFEEGKEEGLKEGTEKAVRLFLANTKFSVEKIAELVGVSVAYVKRLSKKVRGK